MDKENTEGTEIKPEPSLKLEDSRAKFMEQMEKNDPAYQEDVTDSNQESESEETSVTESRSDSSSVKEEVKGVAKKEEPVDKSTELLQNKEKALHEEREKRKQANLKLRELQRQYDDRLKDFEKRLEDAVRVRAKDTEDASDDKTSDESSIKEMRRKLQDMETAKQQEAIVAKQQELNTKIVSTDKKLKEAGFPGFRFAVNRVDEVLKQMYQEGEIDGSDYLDPHQWEEVYKTKIYDEVASEFTPIKKKEIFDRKIEQKKSASKAAVYPGAKPTIDTNDEDEPEVDSIQDYFAFKKKNAPRSTH